MPRIALGTENNAAIEIHYEDHGSVDHESRRVTRARGLPMDQLNADLLEFANT